MTRPAFLTSPGMWLHTRRIAQTQAEYACALEKPAQRSSAWGWRTALTAVICVAACIVIGATLAQGV